MDLGPHLPQMGRAQGWLPPRLSALGSVSERPRSNSEGKVLWVHLRPSTTLDPAAAAWQGRGRGPVTAVPACGLVRLSTAPAAELAGTRSNWKALILPLRFSPEHFRIFSPVTPSLLSFLPPVPPGSWMNAPLSHQHSQDPCPRVPGTCLGGESEEASTWIRRERAQCSAAPCHVTLGTPVTGLHACSIGLTGRVT